MNYIGSKRSLLPAIRPFFEAIVQEVAQPRLLDIFSGTGVVSQFGRLLGFDTVACDLQEYARVTAQALVINPKDLQFPSNLINSTPQKLQKRPRLGLDEAQVVYDLESICSYLENLPTLAEHPFISSYVENGSAGRLYLSKDNGHRVAAARDEINKLKQEGKIGDLERDLLVACLLEGIDRVANTASVYGAYLKKIKKSAEAPFCFASPRLVLGKFSGRAIRGDSNYIVRTLAREGERFDLMYVDPPYNSRLYSSNYHLLETIARWDLDNFTPRGKTGLRPSEEGASNYCSRRGVRAAVLDLLSEAPTDRILFSYSSEGLLSHEELIKVMQEAGFSSPKTTKVGYKRFRADLDHEKRKYAGDEVTEYLIFACRERDKQASDIK